jgi:hypothetical protein
MKIHKLGNIKLIFVAISFLLICLSVSPVALPSVRTYKGNEPITNNSQEEISRLNTDESNSTTNITSDISNVDTNNPSESATKNNLEEQNEDRLINSEEITIENKQNTITTFSSSNVSQTKPSLAEIESIFNNGTCSQAENNINSITENNEITTQPAYYEISHAHIPAKWEYKMKE